MFTSTLLHIKYISFADKFIENAAESFPEYFLKFITYAIEFLIIEFLSGLFLLDHVLFIFFVYLFPELVLLINLLWSYGLVCSFPLFLLFPVKLIILLRTECSHVVRIVYITLPHISLPAISPLSLRHLTVGSIINVLL